MTGSIIESLQQYAGQRGVIMGIARADALNEQAPEGFRPCDLMPGARSVVVLARPLPRGVFLAQDTGFYQRTAYSYYLLMDEAAAAMSLMLEQAGHHALPVPAYSPLRFHRGEPMGMISLKHAAQEAGLGRLGRNTLLIHPVQGNILRLGALMTDMEWPGYTGPTDFDPCPEKCRACERACPAGAISDHGVDTVACMARCIRHVMLPPAIMLPLVKRLVARSRTLTRFMETLSLNFFETYGIGCMACLKACIRFPARGKGTGPTASQGI